MQPRILPLILVGLALAANAGCRIYSLSAWWETVPDERVNPENAEYGKRTRTSLYGIDSRGALWRDVDTAEPVFIGLPPEMPPKA